MPSTKLPLQKTYLQRLRFDPKLAVGAISSYLSNIRVVFLFALGIVLLGLFSYTNLPKRLNPEVKIPIVTIVTALPGAGPTDVESLVSIPLEDNLRNVKGLDQINSTSQNNVSIITMQFFSTVNGDDAKKDVQSTVDSTTTLPLNANKPTVTLLDFEDTPILTFAVTGTKDVHSLMSFSDQLQKNIKNLSDVDRVITTGFEVQEVVVEVHPEKISEYGINPLALSSQIKNGINSYPAGSISTQNNAYALTIDPNIVTIQDIRNIAISVQGHTLKLSDIATVEEKSKTDQEHAYIATSTQSPTRAVTFYVYKTASKNIDEAGAQVQSLLDQEAKTYQHQINITTINSTSQKITKQFTDLVGEFQSTILLVFITLFLFVGLRQAIISSFTIPLTFLSAFVFMRIFGMSINYLSLFALLLALGLLVDDTIVTVSAMTSYFRTGKFTPKQTGLLVWRDTIVPIWSTTITTIWSFIPLLLATGIIGEFIKPIPIVVTVTMISSTTIAVLITLPVMILILKPNIPARVKMLGKIALLIASFVALAIFLSSNPLFPLIAIAYLAFLFVLYIVLPIFLKKLGGYVRTNAKLSATRKLLGKYTNEGVIHVEGFSRAYHNAILRILNSKKARRNVIIAIVAYALFSFLLLPLGFVTNEFFPKSDQEEISVLLELPAGTNIQTTEVEGLKVLNMLRNTAYSNFVIAEIGKSASGGSSTSVSDSANDISYTIHLPVKEKRPVSSIEIAQRIRDEFRTYTQGKISVVEQSGGPPAGSDVQLQLLGPDLNVLHSYAVKLSDYLLTQKGTTNVDISIKPGTSKLVFVPDLTKVNDAGLSADTLGLWMRMYASGFPLASVNFDKSTTTKEDITFRVKPDDIHADDLGTIQVMGSNGTSVPLLSLGSFQAKSNPTEITRENGNRSMNVSAAVTKGYSATKINAALIAYVQKLNLPSGYTWKTGGANDENAKSVASILQAMVVAFVLILITMVVQFGSFRQALIVLIVIPLAVSSVFLIFALTGTPLSFPALIGVLSLFGIVVTNSMFIVDKININKREGMEFKEAIADAGASRMEPIILTKLCTVFGLLPVTLADPLWRGLGGAIISGLLISSTIMLLFIPTLYYEWFHKQEEKPLTK